MIQLPAFETIRKRSRARIDPSAVELVRCLANANSDAGGIQVANMLAARLKALDETGLAGFFSTVSDEVSVDWRKVVHQLNLAEDGTALLVDLRRRLIKLSRAQPELKPFEKELQQILTSWFNGGFLTLRRIDWDSPASLLERLMSYEAVHPIKNWARMRRRLAEDRRCFGFFHPAMPDEPLIFVQVALTRQISSSIEPILESSITRDAAPTTAIFYSISNCQMGLRGIPFGNLLIKRVVTALHNELPSLTIFSTLSPIPGFRKWAEANGEDVTGLTKSEREKLDGKDWWISTETACLLEMPLLRAAARYLTQAPDGRAPDPVAHFHLSNGARVERIDWRANLSEDGLAESYGLMVNYRYRLDHIEEAQKSYRGGKVPRAQPIDALLRPPKRFSFRAAGEHVIAKRMDHG